MDFDRIRGAGCLGRRLHHGACSPLIGSRRRRSRSIPGISAAPGLQSFILLHRVEPMGRAFAVQRFGFRSLWRRLAARVRVRLVAETSLEWGISSGKRRRISWELARWGRSVPHMDPSPPGRRTWSSQGSAAFTMRSRVSGWCFRNGSSGWSTPSIRCSGARVQGRDGGRFCGRLAQRSNYR
jgi:hypothetical protein